MEAVRQLIVSFQGGNGEIKWDELHKQRNLCVSIFWRTFLSLLRLQLSGNNHTVLWLQVASQPLSLKVQLNALLKDSPTVVCLVSLGLLCSQTPGAIGFWFSPHSCLTLKNIRTRSKAVRYGNWFYGRSQLQLTTVSVLHRAPSGSVATVGRPCTPLLFTVSCQGRGSFSDHLVRMQPST